MFEVSEFCTVSNQIRMLKDSNIQIIEISSDEEIHASNTKSLLKRKLTAGKQ
jgi:hypothetical protein